MKTIFSLPATAEDAWVVETLHARRGGFFVDIGCRDGHVPSNTIYLERGLDWTGILVDAHPDNVRKMVEKRPDCKHDERAVSVSTGSDVRFATDGRRGGLEGFLPPAWRQELVDPNAPTVWAQSVRLIDLLRQHHAPVVIDYLSLDIAGAEYPVLLDFFRSVGDEYRIHCMTVDFQMDGGTLMRLQRLLEPHGFALDKVQGWIAFFYNRKELL